MCYLLLQALGHFALARKPLLKLLGYFFGFFWCFVFFFWVPYQDKLFIEAPVLEME